MHGINFGLITRNVAFDVKGFAFYMEDGVIFSWCRFVS